MKPTRPHALPVTEPDAVLAAAHAWDCEQAVCLSRAPRQQHCTPERAAAGRPQSAATDAAEVEVASRALEMPN